MAMTKMKSKKMKSGKGDGERWKEMEEKKKREKRMKATSEMAWRAQLCPYVGLWLRKRVLFGSHLRSRPAIAACGREG